MPSRTSSNDGSMPPPPRSFAPGLAPRKPKADPYDPDARLLPGNDYSFIRDRSDTDVRGTWTTIDKDSNTRQWDSAFESQRNSPGSEGRSRSKQNRAANDPWTQWAEEPTLSELNASSAASHTPSSSTRLNNPDIDSDVEARFVDSRYVMRENFQPLSDFEKRNRAYLVHDYSKPIKNIIGGEIVSTVRQRVDNRAEYRDRDGNYIDGKNRGLMKKRYEEEWKKRMELREEEIVHLTKAKRTFDALTPEEKKRRLDYNNKNRDLVSLLGAGLNPSATSDIYNYEEIPSIYLRSVDPKSIADWTARNTPRSSSVAGIEDQLPSLQVDDPLPQLQTPQTQTQANLQSKAPRAASSTHKRLASGNQQVESNQSKRPRQGVNPTVPSSKPSSAKPPSIRSDTTVRGGVRLSLPSTPSGRTSSIATDSTISVADNPGPELATLKDLASFRNEFSGRNGAMDQFDCIRRLSYRRGRVVTVTLHEPVHYSTSALVERVFGGTIQEIQYFPAERMALVVFMFPSEASALIRHCQNIQENDQHGYRRLQLDIDWYHGLEINAIYPSQLQILASVLTERASRVLLIKGISVKTTTAELAHQMRTRFWDVVLVKCAIISPTKRYVQAREGNMAILEFASIKEAVDVMARFTSGNVQDYESVMVEFLRDQCDRKPVQLPYCDCLHCRRR